MNPVEAAAVLLAVLYLVLAIRENRWCWPAAFGSSLLYLAVFYGQGLYMQSSLQLFYASISVYGWWAWRPHHAGGGPVLAIQRWPLRRHALAAATIAVLTLASGWLLDRSTDASLPYIDSFVTWSAVLTTWMVTRKLLENWLYWMVIDSVTLGIVLDRGLHLTAALFVLYLVMAALGWRRWLKTWHGQAAAGA